MARQISHLLKVLFGLLDAGHVVEGDAGVRLHLELGLGLAHLHGVVAAAKSAWTASTATAAGQQEQTAHQQQWERQVACEREKQVLMAALSSAKGFRATATR